jgi:hypothetical protein
MEIIAIRQLRKLRELEILIRHLLIIQIIMPIVAEQLLLVAIEKVVHQAVMEIVIIIHVRNVIIVTAVVALETPLTVMGILLIVQIALGIGLMGIQVILHQAEIVTVERLRVRLLGEVHRVVALVHQVVAVVHHQVAEAAEEAHVDRDNINKTLTPEIPQKSISGGFFTF